MATNILPITSNTWREGGREGREGGREERKEGRGGKYTCARVLVLS